MERTPFGQGHPYSPGQLSRLLRDNLFQPGERASALHFPPITSSMLLRTAGAWENLGQRWGNAFAGVVLMEADKQIYAVSARQTQARRRPIALSLPARPTAAIGGGVGLNGTAPRARLPNSKFRMHGPGWNVITLPALGRGEG
jgi:hypothetical protein